MCLSCSSGNVRRGHCCIQRPRVVLKRVIVRSNPCNVEDAYEPCRKERLSRLLSITIRTLGNAVRRIRLRRLVRRRSRAVPTSPLMGGCSCALMSKGLCCQRGDHVGPIDLPVAKAGHIGNVVTVQSYTERLVECRARKCSSRVVRKRRGRLGHLCSLFHDGCKLLGSHTGVHMFTSSGDCPLLDSLRVLTRSKALRQGTSVFSGQAVGTRRTIADISATDRTLSVSLTRGTGMSVSFVSRLAKGSRRRLRQRLSNIIFHLSRDNARGPGCISRSRCLSKGIERGLGMTRLATRSSTECRIGIATLRGMRPGSLDTSRVGVQLKAA